MAMTLKLFTIMIASLVTGVLSVTSPPAIAAEQSPIGTWLTQDGDSRIRIARCGNAWCGNVVWLREPNDAWGNPLRDRNNPDPSKRERQLLGLRIFYDMRPTDEAQTWRGRVYNPQDGDTYRAFLMVESEMRMKVKGCGLGGLVCSTQTWSRVSGSQPSQSSSESGSDSSNSDSVR